jgi:hypothetical protein
MKTTVKKKRRLTHAMLDREQEAAAARLRKHLGRLVSKGTKPGGPTHDYKPRMTFRMFCIVMRIDQAFVGTPDYMGIAYWWDHEYKHTMRDATTKERKKAHDALLAAGLPLDGVSDEHAQVIAWATNNGQQASKAMGGRWTPYRGPKPQEAR